MPTLAVWGQGNDARELIGAENVHFGEQTHTHCDQHPDDRCQREPETRGLARPHHGEASRPGERERRQGDLADQPGEHHHRQGHDRGDGGHDDPGPIRAVQHQQADDAGGQPYLHDNWWLAVAPGVMIVIYGFGLSLVGDGLEEAQR